MLASAREAFDQGDYRWSATLLNHLLFAQPDNAVARGLLASAYDQLGYQAESGPWRDIYLTGARELHHGRGPSSFNPVRLRNMVQYTDRSHFFNVMAAQLDAEAADSVDMVLNFNFTDLDENHVFRLRNSVMS